MLASYSRIISRRSATDATTQPRVMMKKSLLKRDAENKLIPHIQGQDRQTQLQAITLEGARTASLRR